MRAALKSNPTTPTRAPPLAPEGKLEVDPVGAVPAAVEEAPEVGELVPFVDVEVTAASVSFQQYLWNWVTHAGVASIPANPRVLSTTAHAKAVDHMGSVRRRVELCVVSRKARAAASE